MQLKKKLSQSSNFCVNIIVQNSDTKEQCNKVASDKLFLAVLELKRPVRKCMLKIILPRIDVALN